MVMGRKAPLTAYGATGQIRVLTIAFYQFIKPIYDGLLMAGLSYTQETILGKHVTNGVSRLAAARLELQ